MATVNSLRKKSRGTQSLPRRQSIHPGMNDGLTQHLPPPPRVRPKDKSKVESLMKRRYSTRGVPPLPSVLEPFPSELSNKSKAVDSSYDEEKGESQLTLDSTALVSRGFDPEQYIASSLSGASEEDVQRLYETLRDLRISTSADLRSNVFKNYASFVSLSHEISSLTSDLSSLSTLLTQFSNLTQSLSTTIQKDDNENDHSSGHQRERRGAQLHRNSIADLAQIHASHLQELWHFVEGSQKFLPAHPGRHVLKESLNWTELNAATWKPTKTVHLILLNDHLLVAARKRGKAASSQSRKSIADRCWNLVDIEVNSLNEERGGPNATGGALQVIRGREIAVYAPPEGRISECASFIQAFKRATIDLYNKRKQTEAVSTKAGQTSMAIRGSNGRLNGNDAIIRRVSINFKIEGRGNALTTNNTDSSVRWVQDRMDDLDVQIALRDFEEAVRSIEKGRQTLASMDPKQVTYPLLSLHLSHRTKQLTDYISHALNLESHLPNSTKRYSTLLIRLGEDDLARSTYLQSRAEYIRRKIRAMQHPGAYGTNEVDGFVESVAWLIVRVIKNSWAVYSETFSEAKMASTFFEWVKEQAEGFSEIFRRQLYGYPQDSQLYKSSKTGVVDVWSELKGRGLDMTFLLDALIEKHSTVEERAIKLEVGSSEVVRGVRL